MSSLLGIHSISKSYGTQVLFKDLSFTLTVGKRVGLVGPNGTGKSTLLKILMGMEPPDEGSISRRQALSLGYASQVPEFPSLSLVEVLLQQVPADDVEALTKARILLSKAQFSDFSQNAHLLSGGWKKRLDIARALMQEPDLLLLDEPTNHLDLEGILWLEKFLMRASCSSLIVSHDRYFLENVCDTIIELNRCYPQGLLVVDGSISTFMERKEDHLRAQMNQERGLASTVRDEIEWLKRSPKARTTKSKSRIQSANELIEELAEVKKRNSIQKVDIEFSASERETRKLLVAKNLSKSLGDKSLFKGVDITLSPGVRLGIVGKNGTGKTTLLKLLAGKISADMGTLKHADDLKIVYFDQHREEIPPDLSLREALCPTGDRVSYRGQSIHVNGWARKFLFSEDRLELPVRCLSGGEKARILIAKLMLEVADVLFLDEPTNDLDIPTLEVIEQNLKEFAGAVVLISHDRCLMDRLCTQILGLGEDSEPQFFADYRQWEQASIKRTAKKESVSKTEVAAAAPSQPKKLSYKEERELEGMEGAIMQLEAEIAALEKELQTDSEKSLEHYTILGEAQTKLEALFTRWEYLTTKKQ